MIARVMAKVTELVQWFQATRVGRLNARYGAVNGAQLAGGIAYAALFSIFSVLTIAFTVFLRLVGDNEELKAAVVSAVDQALPGLLVTADNPNAPLNPDDLAIGGGLTVTTVIATVTLVLSALSVMGALATAIRAMFGLVAPPGNAVLAKVRDLGGFVLLAGAVLATAVLGVGAGAAGGWLTGALGLDSALVAWAVRGLGLLTSFALDALVFAGLVRLVAGARPPARDLWVGAAIGALGTVTLRMLGTSAVGGASANPLLASFAALVTLLLWVNLAARLALYVAAFIANPPQAPMGTTPKELHATEVPNYVTVSAPHTLAWDHDARTGAVQPSEADRLEREEAAREQAKHAEELEAALMAATQEPKSWWSRRQRVRRARRAARATRAED